MGCGCPRVVIETRLQLPEVTIPSSEQRLHHDDGSFLQETTENGYSYVEDRESRAFAQQASLIDRYVSGRLHHITMDAKFPVVCLYTASNAFHVSYTCNPGNLMSEVPIFDLVYVPAHEFVEFDQPYHGFDEAVRQRAGCIYGCDMFFL